MKFLHFLFFCGSFLPSWIRIKPTKIHADLDPKHWNQCCGSCLFDPWIRDPEYFFPGSRIPKPYFWELSDNFLGKKFYNSVLWNLWLLKKVWQKIIFHPSLLLLFLDPGWEKIRIRDKHPGSGIRYKHPGFATLTGRHLSPCILRPADTYLAVLFNTFGCQRQQV